MDKNTSEFIDFVKSINKASSMILKKLDAAENLDKSIVTNTVRKINHKYFKNSSDFDLEELESLKFITDLHFEIKKF